VYSESNLTTNHQLKMRTCFSNAMRGLMLLHFKNTSSASQLFDTRDLVNLV